MGEIKRLAFQSEQPTDARTSIYAPVSFRTRRCPPVLTNSSLMIEGHTAKIVDRATVRELDRTQPFFDRKSTIIFWIIKQKKKNCMKTLHQASISGKYGFKNFLTSSKYILCFSAIRISIWLYNSCRLCSFGKVIKNNQYPNARFSTVCFLPCSSSALIRLKKLRNL